VSAAGRVEVRRTGARADVVLAAPARRNALDAPMWEDLRSAFADFARTGDLRVVVVRGAGGHFAAGADIGEFPRLRHDPASARHYHLDVLLPALDAIMAAPQPVIAAIDGACFGGGLEIALACDVRVAAPGARFGLPVGQLGFALALPELQRLLARVPAALVADLLLTGRQLNAVAAHAFGLVQRLAGSDDLDGSVAQVVAEVLAGSPLAARLNKAHLRQLAERAPGFTAAELEASFAAFASNDYREGIAAFLANRPPTFSGT